MIGHLVKRELEKKAKRTKRKPVTCRLCNETVGLRYHIIGDMVVILCPKHNVAAGNKL